MLGTQARVSSSNHPVMAVEGGGPYSKSMGGILPLSGGACPTIPENRWLIVSVHSRHETPSPLLAMNKKYFRMLEAAAVAGILAVTTATGRAAVNEGSSSSASLNLGVSSEVALQALLLADDASASVNAQALTPASGTAPTVYSVTHGPQVYAYNGAVAGLSIPNPVPFQPALLSTTTQTMNLAVGALNDSAASNVNGSPGLKTTSATSALTNLDLHFGILSSAVLGVPLAVVGAALSVTADALVSNAQVVGAGDGSAFASMASSSVTAFDILVFGASILPAVELLTGVDVAGDLALGLAVDITVDLSLITGLTLPAELANVSLTGGIRISNASSTTASVMGGTASATALSIEFLDTVINADVLGGASVINTDLELGGGFVAGQAMAAEAVPEPSSAMLLLGAGFLLASRLRRAAALR